MCVSSAWDACSPSSSRAGTRVVRGQHHRRRRPTRSRARFVRRDGGSRPRLRHSAYAVLALGDREYDITAASATSSTSGCISRRAAVVRPASKSTTPTKARCAIGNTTWARSAASPTCRTGAPPRYEAWQLRERAKLNPGSVGGGAFHLAIAPPEASCHLAWQAGDIAEIGPRHSTDPWPRCCKRLACPPMRSWKSKWQAPANGSLAALLARSHLPRWTRSAGSRCASHRGNAQAASASRILDLLPTRGWHRADSGAQDATSGRHPGIGSGWLCDYAPLGGEIALRLRSNPNFHAPDPPGR